MSLLLVGGASLVLAIVVFLIFRELKGATPPEAIEEEEMTMIGQSPVQLQKLREDDSLRLPNLLDADDPYGDSDSDSGGESVLMQFDSDEIAIDEPTAPRARIAFASAVSTDVGKKRKRNEDNHLILQEQGLFVVADGMGGYAGGDVASRIAVDTISEAFRTKSFTGKPNPTRPRRGNELVWAIQGANAAVYDAAKTSSEYEGMGTTLVGAKFSSRKKRLYIGHVGDSRCYRSRKHELKQLTTDHTLAQSGVTGKYSGNLSRALGIARRVKVDLVVDAPEPGDVYVVCSDGLSKMLTDQEIGEVIDSAPDLDEGVKRLVASANARGGRDNITVILIKVMEPSGQAA
ncbi:MAG: protein phosphatase 2C domain-containing protein [Polyangiaceae bacterium]